MKRLRTTILAGAAFLALAGAADAQGLFRGGEEGAARGNRAAGPIGGIVGGGIGAGFGAVNGVLGIDRPRSRRPAQRRPHRAHRR